MRVSKAVQIIENALQSPLETWPGFSPRDIPLAIFDVEEIAYLNHPSPPAERPPGLMAATAMPINGILTATIPLWMCQELVQIPPLVYHECFHVYQDSGAFRKIYPPDYNFHRALAVYPELNARQRALCRLEADIYNDAQQPIEEKAALLAALIAQRYAILERQPLALALAKLSERHEGPAYFIQQQVDLMLNGAPIPSVPTRYGYSRQYYSGAAACRLLRQFVQNWHLLIQEGAAPSEIILQRFGDQEADLSALRLDEITAEEEAAIQPILSNVEAAFQGACIRLQIADERAMRGFNPMSVLSLGDGRLLHTDVYFLQGDFGTLQLKQGRLLEDFNTGDLLFPAIPMELHGDQLYAETSTLSIRLRRVTQLDDNTFRLDPNPNRPVDTFPNYPQS